MTPARVLAREAQDQGDTLRVERRPSGSSSRVGPAALDDHAMPTHERCRGYREGRPALARKGATQRCEQRTIGSSIPRRLRLTAQDTELVAQHEDLELLAIGRAAEQDQELEDATQS